MADNKIVIPDDSSRALSRALQEHLELMMDQIMESMRIPRRLTYELVMTEEKWDRTGEPEELIEALRGQNPLGDVGVSRQIPLASHPVSVIHRGQVLAFCAICRRTRGFVEQPLCKKAADRMEAFVERRGDWNKIIAVDQEIEGALRYARSREVMFLRMAQELVRVPSWRTPLTQQAVRMGGLDRMGVADIIRDVFPNPWRLPELVATEEDCPKCHGCGTRRHKMGRRKSCLYCCGNGKATPVLLWENGTILKIARGIYEERRWDHMGILGDALMDAGCENEAILSHCRQGDHVLGCWVIDFLLGKDR